MEGKECSSALLVEALPLEQGEPLPDKSKRQKKLRTACDSCHTSKIRCCGGTPCQSCSRLQISCVRSTSRRQGRPKGARNKKMIEKEALVSKSSKPEIDRPSYDGDGYTLHTKPELIVNSADQFFPSSSVDVDFPAFFTSESDPFLNFDSVYGVNDMSMDNEVPMNSPEDALQAMNTWQAFMNEEQRPQQQQQQQQQQQLDRNTRHNTFHNHGDHRTESDVYESGTRLHMSTLDSSIAVQSRPQVSCNCLQKFAKLLTKLKVVAMDMKGTQRTDAVLMCIRKASTTWKRMLQCMPCRENNAEEVLYLSISGIRIALRNLDMVSSLQDFSMEVDGDTDAAINPSSVAGSEAEDAANTCTTDYLSRANHAASLPRPLTQVSIATFSSSSSSSSSSSTSSSATPGSLASMRNYRMDAEEQQMVARIVAMRLVREIQEILRLLKGRLGPCRMPTASSPQPESSLDALHTNPPGRRQLFGFDSGWGLATELGESSMHLVSLLESTSVTSDMLLYRLRNMSIKHLEHL